MKHDIRITIIMITVFLLAQLVGLLGIVINNDINQDKDISEQYNQGSPIPEQPEVSPEGQYWTWIWLVFAIFLGTAIALVLIRLKAFRVFKLWFFFGIGFCLTFALYPFVFIILTKLFPGISSMDISFLSVSPVPIKVLISVLIGFLLSGFRLWRYNFYIHNITEILIYGGLALLIVGLLNIFSAFVLLVMISIYDMYAVWKSKHMIVLAESQMENRIFSGVMIPYQNKDGKIITNLGPVKKEKAKKNEKKKKSEKKSAKKTTKTAILGGGDIAFPLIFAGTVVTDQGLLAHFSSEPGVYLAWPMIWFGLLIIICATIAISLLFFFGKKDRFYPAMPYISLGCFAGYLIGLGILLLRFWVF